MTSAFKPGDKNKFSNHSPISVLPYFSKSVEKILIDPLTIYIWQIRTSKHPNVISNPRCPTRHRTQWKQILTNNLVIRSVYWLRV